MKQWKKLAAVAVTTVFVTLLAACGKQEEAKVEKAADKVASEVKAKAEAEAKAAEAAVKEAESLVLATEAYVYAYPLVTMEMTRRVMTNVAAPEGTRAPMGQLVRMREYPNAQFRDVTAPNADTLYTTAWLDVSKEPWILSIPDMKGRYFLFPMLDGWTNVFQVPGTRTTGTKAQKYAITGPGWSGTLPDGVTEYKSPTDMVWILGRIYCTGTPEDYKAVHALQDQVSVVPLSAYGNPFKPEAGQVNAAVDMKTAVREQVNALDGAAYFKLFAALLKTSPPAAEDAPMVAKLAKIGIVPGQDFDAGKLEPAVAKGIGAAPKPAQEVIMGWLKAGIAAGDLKLENGWLFTTKTGLYGTSYLQRALITAIGLGANRPAGCGLSDLRRTRCSEEVQRRQQVRHALREGPAAAGERLLVADDVRRPVFLRRQSAQPLHAESAQQAQGQCRRFDRSVHPERVPRQGQGIELAAGAEGRVRPDDAAVLAEGQAALDPRRHVEDSRGEGSVVTSLSPARGGKSRERKRPSAG